MNKRLGNLDSEELESLRCARGGMYCTERVPNDEVLKRVDERRTLIGTIGERRASTVGHMLRYSDWFTALIKGRSRRQNTRQEYMAEIKDERLNLLLRT